MSDNSNQIDSLTVGVGLDSSDFKRGQREIDAGLEQLENSADDAANSVDNLGEKAGKTGKDLSGLGGKSSEASQDIDSLGQSASDTSNSIEDLGGTAEDTVDDVENLGEAAEDAAGDIEELGDASLTAAEKIERLQEQIKALEEDAEGSSEKIADLQDKLDNLKKSGSKTGKSLGSNFDQMARSVRGLANEVMGLMALNKVASASSGKGIGGTVAAGVTEQASLGRQAHNLNISPTKLAGWELTAEKFGGSQQEAQQVLQRIQDMITSNKIDAGQLSPLLTRYVNLHNPDGSMKSADRILFEMLKVLHEKANDPLAPNDINYAIRQSFGGGPGIVEMARLGPERLQRELEAAEARSHVTAQGTEEVTRFSQALTEARQNVEGFGNGLLSWTAKMFGPTLEQLNKDHPELVGAGGAAATAGIVAGGWLGLKKLADGVISKSVEQALKKAGVAATEQAGAGASKAVTAGAKAAAESGSRIIGARVSSAGAAGAEVAALSRLAAALRFANVATTAAWGMQPIKTAGPELDTLTGAGIIDAPPVRKRDRFDDLNSFQQKNLEQKIQSRDSGRIPSVWEESSELRAYDEAIWEEHQKNLEEYRKQAADFQSRMSALPSASGLPLANDAGKSRYSGKVPKALDELQDYLRQLEDQHGLPKGLLTEIAMKESGGNPNAVSRRNGKVIARGMFQFTPATAMQYNLANPHDPMESARAAAEFYDKLSRDFGGDVDKMMASYNSGPGKVQQISRNFGSRWRDWLGPEGQGYVNYEQAPGANKLLQYVARHSKLRADRALAVFPINGDAQQDYSQMQVPQQLQDQVNPALSPAVQQAMIRNDNRRITNTTHIDNMQITAPGGRPDDIMRGAQSALQRHPLRIDGSDYG